MEAPKNQLVRCAWYEFSFQAQQEELQKLLLTAGPEDAAGFRTILETPENELRTWFIDGITELANEMPPPNPDPGPQVAYALIKSE